MKSTFIVLTILSIASFAVASPFPQSGPESTDSGPVSGDKVVDGASGDGAEEVVDGASGDGLEFGDGGPGDGAEEVVDGSSGDGLEFGDGASGDGAASPVGEFGVGDGGPGDGLGGEAAALGDGFVDAAGLGNGADSNWTPEFPPVGEAEGPFDPLQRPDDAALEETGDEFGQPGAAALEDDAGLGATGELAPGAGDIEADDLDNPLIPTVGPEAQDVAAESENPYAHGTEQPGTGPEDGMSSTDSSSELAEENEKLLEQEILNGENGAETSKDAQAAAENAEGYTETE